MFESLTQIIIAASVLGILFFAYFTKNKLATHVVYVILAAYAITMAFSGMASLIRDVDFLSFLVSFLNFLNDLIVFIEIGVIIFLLFFSTFKSKIMALKVIIIVYAVLSLLLALNIL